MTSLVTESGTSGEQVGVGQARITEAFSTMEGLEVPLAPGNGPRKPGSPRHWTSPPGSRARFTTGCCKASPALRSICWPVPPARVVRRVVGRLFQISLFRNIIKLSIRRCSERNA
jgi:hypothetical protein